MPLDEIMLEAEEQMQKAVDFFKQELRGVRTGRASTSLIDGIKVEVPSYGSTMALRELANVGVAEGNTLVVKPFDPSTIKDIDRALDQSELGINPQNDGKIIRLPVPPLSEERRNQLVARVKDQAEQQKVAIRNTRRDANKRIQAEEKEKSISEDDRTGAEDEVQKLTDQYVKTIDSLLDEKTKEIMEV